MILGTQQIQAGLLSGQIICEPLPVRVEGAHIDVTLGEYTWVADYAVTAYMPDDDVESFVPALNLATAEPRRNFLMVQHRGPVVFPARSFSLAHTVEFIGTAPGSGLVPILHTRSTLARWGLSVHLSAGWGDEGYASRWTLEIVNPHDVDVSLPVGARVGCIVFQEVTGAAAAYQPGTRYNVQRDVWTPDAMLPRKGNW